MWILPLQNKIVIKTNLRKLITKTSVNILERLEKGKENMKKRKESFQKNFSNLLNLSREEENQR